MAYPTVAAPYGFKPVNLIGGQVFAGSTRNLPIQYNYNANIYYGVLVTLSAGYIVPATAAVSTTNTTVGVFLGCYFTSPATKQRLFSQFYPASTAAGDITAIVGDDPDSVFQVAVTTAAGATTIGSASSLLVGLNLAGNTLTGTSGGNNGQGAVVNASATTSGGGFRLMNLVPDSQITTAVTYVSGGAAAATAVVVSGLTVGQVIPIGTDLFNMVGGQMQFTGSTVSTAATVSSATSQSLTVTTIPSLGNTGGPITATNIVLVQSPEVLVKLNFGAHRYYVA
jgi:hypothetical protein